MAERAAARPILKIERSARLLRREPCATGRVADARARRSVGGRPQRHGQDDALQHDRRPEARRAPARSASTAARSPRSSRTRSTGSASATCRRGGASGRASRSTSICACRRRRRRDASGRSSASTRPSRGSPSGGASGGSQLSGGEQQMLAIAPRAARQSAPAGHGRADRRARADHRRPGRARCWSQLAEEGEMADPAHRAEYRRRHRGLRPRRHHGQRPHQPHHGGRARSPPTASCSSGCSASAAMTTRKRPCRRQPRPAQAPKQLRGARSFASSAAGPPQPQRRPAASTGRVDPNCRTAGTCRSRPCGKSAVEASRPEPTTRKKIFAIPFAERIGRTALVVGTFDTKGRELRFHPRPAARRSAFRPARSISRPRASRRAPT